MTSRRRVAGWLGAPLASVVAMGLLAGACTSEAGEPAIAATVGGVDIPSMEIERLLDQVDEDDAEDHEHGDGTSLEHRAALSFLVRLELLELLATEHGIDVVSNEIEVSAAQAIPDERLSENGVTSGDLERGLRASRLALQLGARLFADVAVAEDEIASYYQTNRDQYAAAWVVDGHIFFFDDAAAAEGARAALTSGASMDAVTSEFKPIESGPLDSVGSDAPLPDPLHVAIGSTPALSATEVISDEPGVTFTVVWVQAREDVPEQPIDEVRDQIRTILVRQLRDELFWQWFEEQLSAAPVDVDPYYGTWSTERGMVTA